MKLLLFASLVVSFFLLVVALVLPDRNAKKRSYLIFGAIGSYLLLITAFYISDLSGFQGVTAFKN